MNQGEWRLFLAWVVALAATLGSLYFSEVRGFLPCALCWYQRVMMYPLVVVLGLGVWRSGDPAASGQSVLTARILAFLGLMIAGYHVLEERGLVQTLKSCQVGVPCTTPWINVFGFITIPVLSLTAFTLILALLWPSRKGRAEG